MVYCGKASQGCQSCRKRRIKCDKVKPACSQCLRLGKQCPGYRDQLSLMFRDESSKVIQKAHAQWGNTSPETAEPSSSRVSLPSPIDSVDDKVADTRQLSYRIAPRTTVKRNTHGQISPSVSSSASSFRARKAKGTESDTFRDDPPLHSTSSDCSSNHTQTIIRRDVPSMLSHSRVNFTNLGTSLADQGLNFYLKRYLVGQPDEPKTLSGLRSLPWLQNPCLQDIMSAIGLTGLSNLTGNKEMMAVSREKYGQALIKTSQLIHPSNSPDLEVTIRSIIMLAMFEVVKGTHYSQATVHTHVTGGGALIKSWIPLPNVPFNGFRALINMYYSQFIPLQLRSLDVPASLFDLVAFGLQTEDDTDKPAADLAVLIARHLQLNAFVENHVLSDGKPRTANAIRQLLDLDAEIAAWEQSATGVWRFQTVKAPELPAKAVFRGEYHRYSDALIARTWNYYRWSRLHINQTLLDLIDKNPISITGLVSAAKRSQTLRTIRRLAKELLISVPSHWRHPLLDENSRITVGNAGGGGSGAAGLPALLFQIKVASCAPGVPVDYWLWALDIMQTAWGETGILYARNIMEGMRAHQDHIQRRGPEGILSED